MTSPRCRQSIAVHRFGIRSLAPRLKQAHVYDAWITTLLFTCFGSSLVCNAITRHDGQRTNCLRQWRQPFRSCCHFDTQITRTHLCCVLLTRLATVARNYDENKFSATKIFPFPMKTEGWECGIFKHNNEETKLPSASRNGLYVDCCNSC